MGHPPPACGGPPMPAICRADGATRGGHMLDIEQVEITATDVPDGISAEDHSAGMASSLSNLAEHLEQ